MTMSVRDYQFEEFYASKHLTNDDPQVIIKEDPGSTRYLVIDNITLSVHEPAMGGGGKLKLTTVGSGEDVWEFDVNGIKDISFPIGWKELPSNEGLVGILYGAGVAQAEVWISVSGYIAYN